MTEDVAKVAAIRLALVARDERVAECPVNKPGWRGGRDKCPRCHAGPDEGCRITVVADANLVTAVRQHLQGGGR